MIALYCVLGCIGGVLFLYTLTLAVFAVLAKKKANSERIRQRKEQKERLENLKNIYEKGLADRVNEQSFCAFDLQKAIDGGVTLDKIGFLATHNSYKAKISKQAEVLYDLANFGTKFNYEYPSFTDQLNAGIRSLEIDLSKAKENGRYFWECSHVFRFDNRTTTIDFMSAFEEVSLWSQYNPRHLPITLMIEIKLPGLQTAPLKTTMDDVKELDEKLRKMFKDRLYTPKDMLGNYRNFKELREASAFPKLSDLMGKVLVLLHPNTGGDAEKYYRLDESLQTQAMFPMTKKSVKNRYPEGCVFANSDSATSPEWEELMSENYLVRIRADKYPSSSHARRASATQSGAYLIATDYPEGATKEKDAYSFGGKTVLCRDLE